MSTIRGESITLIRPTKIHVPVKDNSAWKVNYHIKPKTRQLGTAEFFRLCLMYGREEKTTK